MTTTHFSYVFFNKNGLQQNFVISDGLITGTIFLPESSVNMIENETLYVLSKFWNTSIFDVIYGKPRGGSNLLIKFKTKDEIFKFFTVDTSMENAFIESFDELIIGIDTAAGVMLDDEYLIQGSDPVVNEAVKFNILAKSTEGGVYDNSILIYLYDGSDKILIADIQIVATITAVDERFTTILSNFGESVDEKTYQIFRETDINDLYPDVRVMNKKMKELILEFSNIFPNTSSLRGLSNMLKFFGYDDMRIKEYWMNTESGKFVKKEISLGDDMDKKISVLRKPYKKMPYFGLYYDLNKPIGTYDDEGLPDMEDDIFFTRDEMVIKLFGLKKYIENRNIGGISKIIDIIGEANYFNKISYFHHVETSELITDTGITLKPNVVINDKYGYIKDLREYLYTTNRPICLLSANSTSSSVPDQIYNHYSCIIGFFDNINVAESELFAQDNYDIPVGFLLNLENKTFDIPASQIETSLADLADFYIPATCANLTSINYYKLKWEIERDSISDGRKFYHSFIGNISESSRYLNVILPYTGEYTIKLTIYGYGNNNIYYSYKSVVVDTQQIDFCGFFQEYDKNLNVVGLNTQIIKDCDTRIKDTIYRKSEIPARVEARSLNLASYMDLNQFGNINIGVRNDYPVNKIDASIRSMGHVRIADFGYHKERMPDFNIIGVTPGGKISINGDEMIIDPTININDFGLLKNQIEAHYPDYYVTLREGADDGSKFIDIRRDEDEIWAGSDNDDISCVEETFTSIDQIGYPIKDVPVVLETGGKICHTTAKVNPFNRNNVVLSSDTLDIHQYTCVFFCDDISPNLGKTKQTWSVYYEEDQKYLITDITCRYFNYRFEFPGFYTIELSLEDSNGNKYTKKKKNFINVVI